MKVQLDSEWLIEIDQNRNHIPFRYREVMERIPECRGMQGTGRFEWISENQYFASIRQVIELHIIPKMMEEKCNDLPIKFDDYICKCKELTDYFAGKLNANQNK